MSISAAASVGRASRGLLLGLMWVVASRPLSGCTLLAPNDDHYTSDPARVPAQSEGGESGRAHGVGGASSDHAEGGANALAGNSRGGAGAGASG
ncbi:MAG TPA: hypothetical protein VFK05_29445, partial [Polyangiaceae bacterium]|nr:hypothetical protein [Polyangiaceae bacterium]